MKYPKVLWSAAVYTIVKSIDEEREAKLRGFSDPNDTATISSNSAVQTVTSIGNVTTTTNKPRRGRKPKK